MSNYNRILQTKCHHFNFKPIIYINADMYIFYCPDCHQFILRYFNDE
jgi:hypothetical protein